ncbi:unnamed protein product [Moneuplotes crassus]|uniref:BZIP domain-containing protein n=1 Tax=Euplotes crassus TaxID=5936 RepID=A0AAD1UPT8_EUPCR|nr:unnamed protein product [Moneuplotes crassus]
MFFFEDLKESEDNSLNISDPNIGNIQDILNSQKTPTSKSGEKDYPEHASDNDPKRAIESGNKLEERRKRDRIRKQISRGRHKAYVEQLENKIKELEKENFRLQNLLVNYRSQDIDKVDNEAKSYIQDCKEERREIIKPFINTETADLSKETNEDLSILFNRRLNKMMNKHKKFLDRSFEMIINNPYPITRYKYWGDFKPEYNTDFEVIKKFHKCTKYQIEDFKEKHNFSLMDEFVASFMPNKRQFDFIKNVALKREYLIKKDYENGIKHLLQAKEIFEKTNIQLLTFVRFFLSSGFISHKQILGSRLKEDLLRSEEPFNTIWNVQVEPKKYSVNMKEDPIIGKLAQRCVDKEIHECSYEYNHYSLPSSV